MAQKYDFIKDLQKLKKEFIQYAEENSSKIDPKSFEIQIHNGYLCMYLEAEDKRGFNILFFKQEIEMDYKDSAIYQKPIYVSNTSVDYTR